MNCAADNKPDDDRGEDDTTPDPSFDVFCYLQRLGQSADLLELVIGSQNLPRHVDGMLHALADMIHHFVRRAEDRMDVVDAEHTALRRAAAGMAP